MDVVLQRLKEIGIKPEGEPIILQEEDGTILELIPQWDIQKKEYVIISLSWKAKIIQVFQIGFPLCRPHC
jgi:hypothetical protein